MSKKGLSIASVWCVFLCRACHSSINVKRNLRIVFCLLCISCHPLSWLSNLSFLYHVKGSFEHCVCLLCDLCHIRCACIMWKEIRVMCMFAVYYMSRLAFLYNFSKRIEHCLRLFSVFPRHVDQNRTLLRIGAHSPRRELGAHPIRSPIRMPTRYFLRGEVTPDLRKLSNQEHGTIELHDKFHVIRRLRCSNVHKHPGECAYEHVGRLFAWLAYKRCRLCTNRRVCSKAWECCTTEGEGEENGVSTCFEFLSWGFWLEELPYRRVMSVRFNTLSEDDIHVGCDKVLTTLNPTHGKRLWKISSLVCANQTAAPCGSQPDYLQMFGVYYRCFLRCQSRLVTQDGSICASMVTLNFYTFVF